MSTISNTRQPATLTIPAEYLEDVRTALIQELDFDSDWLRVSQGRLVSHPNEKAEEVARGDRAGAMRAFRNDAQLLDQILDAAGSTDVEADRDALTGMLQALVRVLAKRLKKQCGYAPIDMGAALDLAARLRWAAGEAIRIEPALDERGSSLSVGSGGDA